jgi:peroxiredoxin
MAQLRLDYPEFEKRNVQLVAIGPEDREKFSEYWITERMPFKGIPDPRHRVADLYKQKVDFLKLGRMPAMMIVDKNGKLRYQHYGSTMMDIPEDREILAFIDELNKEA